MTLVGVDAVCSWGCLWFLGLFGCSLSVGGVVLFGDFVFAVL